MPNYPAAGEALDMIHASQSGGERLEFLLEGECMPAGLTTRR